MSKDSAPVLLDVTRLLWRRWVGREPTGIDRVCLAYLRHFGPKAQAVVQHRRVRRIFDPQASEALFDLLAKPARHFGQRLIICALRFGLRNGCKGEGRIYLNIGHTGLNEQGFRNWLAGADVRPVYFVHDLIPITHPEFCRRGELEKHRERMRTVVATASGAICNSNVTLDALSYFARSEGLARPAAIVAPLGSDSLPCVPSAEAQGRRPTFVILGTIEARKNHLMLLHVWTRLVRRLGADAPRLLIIGQRGWECDQVFDLLDRSELLKGSVEELGKCDDESVAAHLAGARALLFPSLYEGFGMPLVEALRAGVPVIASDLPVFRELAGDVPDYLDPLDGPGWERTILFYAEKDSSARKRQLRRLAPHRLPAWQDHFASVDSWLATL